MTQETWDKPLSESLREEAIKLFEEYAELSQVKFHRSVTPPDWKSAPTAITFSDGSDKTYGAVLYLRWISAQGAEVRLVEAKAKLTPLDQKGEAVKAEVCGAVFATRLRKYFERHSRMQVERWFHLVDSQTVLGAIQRDSYGYQTFFANRIGEIQKSAPVEDWWWISGDLNIADIITRGCSASELKEGSTWQGGPDFLKLPVEDWPIKSPREVAAQAKDNVDKMQRKSFTALITRSQSKQNPPENVDMKVKGQMLKKRPPAGWINKLIVVERFSSLQKLVGTVAWTWRVAQTWLEKDKVKDHSPSLTATERQNALRDLFLAAQEGQIFPDTALKRLVVYKDKDGVLMCGGRFQAFVEEQTAVPILPFQSWISILLAREAHSESHDGVAGTLLRMRKKAWVIKGRRHANRVVNSCVTCRKNKAKACQQVMGDLPPERITPARPFEFTTVDLFGPYKVKDEAKKRTQLKVWGIVFCCMASRAIQTDIVSDQSSEGFLLAYHRPALKELYEYLDRLNKQELEENAAKNGTEWSWKIHPANSPHRNGAAEAAVRLVKRALHNLGGDGVFTWSEFQTLLFMAANLVNERPIDAKVQSREECISYVSPNSLLLGRASSKGDSADFNFEGYTFKRLQIIQSEVKKFWSKWCQLAGPNLFVRSKWHTRERNVAIGDIVWVADQNALRGQYKLGRVVDVNKDTKGIVRDANIRVYPSYPVPVKLSKSQVKTSIPATILQRDVRRLIVLLPVEEYTKQDPKD
ncbi:hypothetical protein WMY93_017014 [Mugilogobius chulae]|uniref:Integrase catalytic domain-containing protein n=1 Tax=Mugilogobius chulae TaxID=88201 RepID=A0AAW0NX81_9GOBI